MTIDLAVRHRLGDFQLNASFNAEAGVTALFGRSGSGKTSLVRILAGLTRPDWGRLTIAGETLLDTEAGVAVPTHRRRIGYVFQDARLFPHLTVRQNLLYGRWFQRCERRASWSHIVDMLDLGPLLGRGTRALSGGEKSRVAIGRALLADPRVLLLDEPLAALDEARRAEILVYVERLRDEAQIPIVYVSHAMPEVIRLARTIVVMEAGAVLASGPAAEVLSRFDLPILAAREDAGVLIEASVIRHDPQWGASVVGCRAGELRLPRLDLPEGAPVRLRIQARDVLIARDPPTGLSAQNVLPGLISAIRPGTNPEHAVEILLDCGGDPLIARLTRRSSERLGLAVGHTVYAVIKSVALHAGGEANEGGF
jgi:molybdate transport system ATP-binding protein